jgi:hypothetical protein
MTTLRSIVRRCLRGRDRGSALLATFVTLFFMTTLAVGLMAIVRSSTQISSNQKRDTRALFVAEAGVQEVIERLSLGYPTNVTINGGTFNAAIKDTVDGLDPNWRAYVFNATPGAVSSIPGAGASEEFLPTTQPSADWLDYASASDPDEALIVEHKWVDRDGDAVREDGELVYYDRAQYPPENFSDDGQPVDLISVLGKDGASRRRLEVEVTRIPINPNLMAAVLSDNSVDVRGNVFVDGHNHAFDMPAGLVDPACQAYELDAGRTDESLCVTAVMTTGDPIDRDGSTDLFGSPTPEDTNSTNPFYTLAQTLGITEADLAQILEDPDYTSANDAAFLSGVTYINGNATGAEKFTNVTGEGLLYVNGNMECSGIFQWRGLIYIEGDFTITGSPWVLGAIVCKGETEWAFAGGTPDILFSREAIKFFVGRALGYTILSWKRR